MRIRGFRRGDEAGVAEVCLRTALAGADATGVLNDDALWAAVYALPYVTRHPEYAFVLADDEDERVAGYVLGTPDTSAFEEWFRSEWWPRHTARWPHPSSATTRQDEVLTYAYGRGDGADAPVERYPAHLHIDLLPEAQGAGWGRRLIDELMTALRRDGVTGLHLVADAANTGAAAFYLRIGFEPIPSTPDVRVFARAL